jgi:sugar O-acyltransferase (sialic acid O-acetyltransferase NeuD family)
MKDIVIFGTGQTSEIIYHCFIRNSNRKIAAFTTHSKFINKNFFLELPVVPFEKIQIEFPPDKYEVFIAISYENNNMLRKKIFEEVKRKNYLLASYISPESNLDDDIPVGENCLILESNVVQPFATIGNNVFIWGNVSIGHHSVIQDHCWITPGSSIGGNTTLGSGTFLGINCTIGHLIDIGKNNFIGANALITKNTKENSVYIIEQTEKFLLDSERFSLISKMQ